MWFRKITIIEWTVYCAARLTRPVDVTGGQLGAVQPFSDEEASVETLSHCSSFSDANSLAEDSKFDFIKQNRLNHLYSNKQPVSVFALLK